MFKKNTALMMSLLVLLFLFSCNMETDDNNKDEKKENPVNEYTIRVVRPGVKYFSLSAGQELDGEAAVSTKDWDLRFSAGSAILTNSGSTAESVKSGGKGGVVFLNTTDFNVKVNAGDYKFDKEFETDKNPFVTGMGGASATNHNVMSFPGYSAGDGTEASPFTTVDFSKSAFFSYAGMPPVFEMNNRVYLVRHGNGTDFSKVQITSMEYFSGDDGKTNYVFTLKVQKI